MAPRPPSERPARPARRTLLHGLAVLAVAVAAIAVPPSLAGTAHPSPSSEATSAAPQTVRDAPGRPPVGGGTDVPLPARAGGGRSSGAGRSSGDSDGAIPDGVTVSVLDEGRPAVRRLDRDLLEALRRAGREAAADGVEVRITSGWRSPAHQQQLWRDAVAEHGSEEEAARWVATAETSAHVSGEAVDIGPDDAEAWLSEHGAAYGLCQIYRNEPWHYELRPDAVAGGCPRMYRDPTEDPRMRP